MIVLLQYARLSYGSHCAIVGCFVQIRTSSVVQAGRHVLRKFRPRQPISELVQRCGEALRHGFEPRLTETDAPALRDPHPKLDPSLLEKQPRAQRNSSSK